MKRRLQLRVQARLDFLEAVEWYESEGPELGQRFTAAIDEVLQNIVESPASFALVHRDIRRALAPVFPYGVFFRAVGETILVLAIIHLARDPDLWKGRK